MIPAPPADRSDGQGSVTNQVIDLDVLEEQLPKLRAAYRSASPFPPYRP